MHLELKVVRRFKMIWNYLINARMLEISTATKETRRMTSSGSNKNSTKPIILQGMQT